MTKLEELKDGLETAFYNKMGAEHSYQENFDEIWQYVLDNFEPKQVSVEPVVMQKIARENRYTFTGESITGYWIIRDKKDNNDATIFIDCPKEYMIKIVETLNSNFSA